ncbi:hypothetical protein THAOC_21125 [Thalassiosira oceanica]|uniref:Uncharacterized protein n=1 Tax=Thalassiosira oceanica TaxID=159749 RepID=K0S1U1_THAOC|nr:hypothetical protein THAOC_21125 [Thalassiosira oceanica]|eukprot:EJK58724.1 hypothetical protein THAOC_21125 [Thalassiosira oceanica]
MGINTLLKVLEQLLHKIKAKRRREMIAQLREMIKAEAQLPACPPRMMSVSARDVAWVWGFGGWVWGGKGRQEAQAPSRQVKNYTASID